MVTRYEGDTMTATRESAKFLTLPAAARLVGVGVRALYRAGRRGEFPIYDVDSWPRVRPEDIARWVEGRRRSPIDIRNTSP
jgi:hypothetical protein